MRLIVISLLLVCAQVQAGEQGTSAPDSPRNLDFGRLDLSDLLISADRIVVCTPRVKAAGMNDDYVLFELEEPNDLLEYRSIRPNRAERNFLAKGKVMTLDMPALMPGVKNLLFLRKKTVDRGFLDKHGLDELAGVYELCAHSKAAICLDFSGEYFRKNIIWAKYQIGKAEEFVDIVRNLAAWRPLDDSKKPQALLDLLNSPRASKQSLYQDNIIPILQHLGKGVVHKQGQYLLNE